MGLRDHVICDSDLHVMEPPDLWERYMEPAYAHAAPRGLSEMPRDMRVKVKNHVMLRMGACAPDAHRRPEDRLARGARRTSTRRPRRAGGTRSRRSTRWTPRASTSPCCSRPAACSCSGSTRSSRSAPMASSPATPPPSPVRTTTGCSDFCDHAPDRMFGAGMVAPHDVDGAVDEARRCVEELGFKSIFLAPATVNRRPWHHPAYDPLWAEIAAPRRADHVPRRRADLPHARLRPRGARPS